MALVVTGWAVRTLGLAASLERYNFAALAAGKFVAVAEVALAAGKFAVVVCKHLAGQRLDYRSCRPAFAFR